MVCAGVGGVLWEAPAGSKHKVGWKKRPRPAVLLSLSSTTEELLQVSEDVGEVKLGLAGHSTVPLSPWPPIVGGWSSTTMMVWLTVPLVLPQASTACQVLVWE